MLNLFRSNQLILGVFLLGYALLLRFWLLYAAGPVQVDPQFPLISGWLYERFNEPYWLSSLATTVLIWIQALLINGIVARNRMAPEINLFPGLFYIMLCSALPTFQEFSSIHVANTFLILAMGQILQVYKQNRCMDFLFNAGLFVGLASICYGPYIIFLLPVLFGLNILRAFNLREWLAVIIGGAIPLLWLVILGYLQENLADYWSAWVSDFSFFGIRWRSMTSGEMTGLALFGLLILIILFNYGTNLQKTIIEVRKKIDILYWFLFFGLIIALVSESTDLTNLLLVSLPAGILLSFTFSRMSRPASELMHLFLLIGILLLHYLTYSNII